MENAASSKDALRSWVTFIQHCKTLNNDQFLSASNIFLKTAASSPYRKELFYNVVEYFNAEAKKRNVDNSYILTILKMQNDPTFSDAIVQSQLFYYYSQFYYHLEEYFNAERYCRLFLSEKEKAFPEPYIENITLNAMTTLGFIYRNTNKLDQAIAQLQIVLDSCRSKKKSFWEGLTLGNIAYCYFLKGNYNEAIPLLKQDITLSRQEGETGSRIRSQLLLGNIFLKKNLHLEAYPYFDSVRTIIQHLVEANPENYTFYMEERKDLNIGLGNYYLRIGDYLNSSKCFSDSYMLNDSLNLLNISDEYKHTLQRFEMDRNDEEINKLKIGIERQKSIVEITIILALSLLIILMLFIFFYKRIAQKNQLMEEQSAIIHEQNKTLEKINAEKDRLFAIIGHDLKGPSVNLKLMLQAFSDKKIPISEFEKLLPDLLKSSSNLNSTLESLLNWSVMRSNQNQFNPEAFDLKATIDKVLDFLSIPIKEKSITIKNQCISEMVFADRSQVEVVIRNLISNAVKYSFAQSGIEIGMEKKENEIAISIRDQGTGMSEKDIQQIMDDFSINSKQGTNGEKGTGLGLKLVKEYVERNKGKFSIDSQLNIGTTMLFTLPVSKSI